MSTEPIADLKSRMFDRMYRYPPLAYDGIIVGISISQSDGSMRIDVVKRSMALEMYSSFQLPFSPETNTEDCIGLTGDKAFTVNNAALMMDEKSSCIFLRFKYSDVFNFERQATERVPKCVIFCPDKSLEYERDYLELLSPAGVRLRFSSII